MITKKPKLMELDGETILREVEVRRKGNGGIILNGLLAIGQKGLYFSKITSANLRKKYKGIPYSKISNIELKSGYFIVSKAKKMILFEMVDLKEHQEVFKLIHTQWKQSNEESNNDSSQSLKNSEEVQIFSSRDKRRSILLRTTATKGDAERRDEDEPPAPADPVHFQTEDKSPKKRKKSSNAKNLKIAVPSLNIPSSLSTQPQPHSYAHPHDPHSERTPNRAPDDSEFYPDQGVMPPILLVNTNLYFGNILNKYLTMESSSSKNKGKYLNLNFEKEFPSIPGKPLFDFHCSFKMPSGLSLSGVLFVTRTHLCFASYSTPIFKYHHKQIIEMEKLSIIHHTVSSIILVSRTHKKQVYEMTDLDDLQFILSKITKLWLQAASKEPSPPHSAHSNTLRAPLPTTPLSRSRSDSSLKKRNISKLKRGKIAITETRQRTYSETNGPANVIDQMKWGSQSDRTHSVPPSDGEEEKDPDIESYVSSGSLDRIAQEANGSETEEERPSSVVRVMRNDFFFEESQYLDTLRLKEIRDFYTSYFYGRYHYNFLGLDGDRKCVCVVSVLPEGITSDLPPGVAPGALRAVLTDKNSMDEFFISESSLKKKDAASSIELFLNRHCVENISFYSLPNEFCDDFAKFTQQHFKPVKTLKVGVLYAKPDQTLQQIFQNTPPPDNPFWKFMDTIASKIELNGWKKYTGDFGLVDQPSYYTEWKGIELMFHVAPLLNKEQHRQLIGNDIVFIIYYDSEAEQTFHPSPLSSLGIIPQVFCIVQAEEGPSYKLQFLQRTNIKMFDPVAPPRNHFFKTSEISDYLFTKLHNGYIMSTQCPPMNHLVSTPRKAFLEDFGEKYSKERLRRLRSKSKSTSRTKINQEIKHNSLRDEHISMRAKFATFGNEKNKVSPRCNDFETNPIPTPNKPLADFSEHAEVKLTTPLQPADQRASGEENVKVQPAPVLGRLQHFQTMLYNEYQNLPPLSSSQPLITEKYNPSQQPPSPAKDPLPLPGAYVSPRNEAVDKENCKPAEAVLSSGSTTKEVQVWFKTFMGGKFSDISQYFVEDDGFDLLGYTEDQFSRIIPDQRASLRLYNALKIYK